MSDVVAVSLITGLLTVFGALGTGALAVWRERLRLGSEGERHREDLDSQTRQIRAEAVRGTRARSVELLRDWIRHAVAMSVDVEFLMLAQVPESRKLVAGLLDKMITSAEEASVNVALSEFSDVRILKKVREIEGIRNQIRVQLVPSRDLAAKAPLDQAQLAELGRLLKPAHEKCDELDSEVAELNGLLEQYLGGLG